MAEHYFHVPLGNAKIGGHYLADLIVRAPIFRHRPVRHLASYFAAACTRHQLSESTGIHALV